MPALTPPGKVEATTKAIDEVYVAESNDSRHYPYMRGSKSGHACDRHLWFVFRWTHPPEQFSGRILRLFNTGHREEDRIVDDLLKAGVTVKSTDPATGNQWRVEACDGHFRGHLDGVVSDLPEDPRLECVLEIKTHSDKSFRQLAATGVTAAKPEHLAQMQAYMHLQGLGAAFYLAKNKNTDDFYAEIVRYDPTHGEQIINRAEHLVKTDRLPIRVSDDPDYFLCRAFKCPSYNICHQGGWAERNCRTCIHSEPIPKGQWRCARFDRVLSRADQKAGCPHHLYLPDLVPGEQIDADESAETITYALSDGEIWTDGQE